MWCVLTWTNSSLLLDSVMWCVLTWTNSSLLLGWCYMVCADWPILHCCLDGVMWCVLTWTNSSLLFGWCYVVCADLDQFFIAAWMVLCGVCWLGSILHCCLDGVMWCVLTRTNSSLLFGRCYVVCADSDQFFIAVWTVLCGVCWLGPILHCCLDGVMWYVLTWTNSLLLLGWCYVVCADLDQFFIAAWMVLCGVCWLGPILHCCLDGVMWCVLTWTYSSLLFGRSVRTLNFAFNCCLHEASSDLNIT